MLQWAISINKEEQRSGDHEVPVNEQKRMLRTPCGLIMLLLLLLLVVTTLGGCLRGQPSKEDGTSNTERAAKVLKVGVTAFPDILDPIRMNPNTWQWAVALYDGLVRLDPETGQLKPALAQSWDVSPDKLQYTFFLHKDVKFSGGKEVKAKDVKYSLERVFSSPAPPELAYYLQDIAGSAERMSGKEEVTGLKIIDDYTFRITLSRPNSELLSLLTYPAASIIEPYVITGQTEYGAPGTYDRPAGQVSGTGPFNLVEFVGNSLITLEANPRYYGGKPPVNRVEVYRLQDEGEGILDLQAGDIDLLLGVTNPEQMVYLGRDDFLQKAVKVKMSSTFYYLGFNTWRKPLDQLPLRRAIALALQQENLASQITGSSPLEGLAPKGWIGAGLPSGASPETVRQSISEVVYGQDQPLKLTLSFTSEPLVEKMAEYVEGQMASYGIEIGLQKVKNAADLRFLLQSGGTDLYIFPWDNSVPGPLGYLYSQFHSRPLGVKNLSAYSNSLVDTFLDLANAEEDKIYKDAAYKQAADLLLEDVPAIGLVENPLTIVARPGIRGLVADPRGFLLLNKIWMNQE
ncbi:MAG: ABC transporter substrate-binding protein [Bacillota bacterium]